MHDIEFGGKEYALDSFGFLADFDQWDEGFAQVMAERVGLYEGLGESHWTVIRYIRAQVAKEGGVPFFVIACKEVGLRIGEFRRLFPMGYFRGACRIAGVSSLLMFETNFFGTYETTYPKFDGYDVTETGFLKDFRAWDENFADVVARESRLLGGLTERHRQVLRFLRKYFEDNRVVPVVFETCREIGLSLDELHTLFPSGYRRGACRMAGLPMQP